MPDLNQMQISVEVPEIDYRRIELGQKVIISVEAVKDLNTTGKIKKKTLVGKQTESQTSVKTYEVIVSVDSCHLKMKPGLSALCQIIVDEVEIPWLYLPWLYLKRIVQNYLRLKWRKIFTRNRGNRTV